MADPLGGIAELASHTPFKGGANINPFSSAGTGMCGDVSGTASGSGMSGYNTRYDYRWRVVRVCVLLMLCIVDAYSSHHIHHSCTYSSHHFMGILLLLCAP